MPEGAVIQKSVITCPHCAFSKEELMPLNACRYFYVCEGCQQRLVPEPGDCCVFCSYGSVKCPPVQMEQPCCASAGSRNK